MTKNQNEFVGTTVILPVTNVQESAQFYKQKLGFEISGIWENPAYGSVKRENAIIEFGEGRKEFAGSGICYIHVENADSIFDEWKSKGIEFVGDFSDREYGNKDFRIRDNNGNILIVGHALVNKNELLQNGKAA
ncbi:MAG: hypothetical protein GY786_19965 [Proteobacteria bacterium]|nr:hypothetical protein [Pseudomonadota bacterium]